MSDFYDLLEEYIGQADALTDIRITVRRAWFYDFDGYPIRVWQGKGKLFTSDGNEWLGSIDGNGTDHHTTPAIQDGRDGSSASYTLGITIPTLPGDDTRATYDALKADQWRVAKRKVTCYLVLFKEGEALRPTTPLVYFKELTMQSPLFNEVVARGNDGAMTRTYSVSIVAKDANYGRSNTPNRTVSDASQKEYARQLGVTTEDRGCEFVAGLASRTYIIP